VRTARPFLHDASLCDDHADGQAGAESLRQRHNVRHHIEVLRGEHLARAADAGLDLVKNQQNAVPIAQFPQALQKSIGGNQVAALALNRLDENGRHFAGRHVVHEQYVFDITQHRTTLIGAGEQRPVVVRIGHVSDARHAREESLLLSVFAGGERQRPHGPPVEAAEKPDEPAAPRGVSRQFQRRFDALGPRLRKETHGRLFHRRQFIEALRQSDLALVPVVGRDVQEPIRGILDGLHHGGVTVSGAAHGDAGGEIQKSIAVDIPNFRTLAVRHHKRIVARIRWRDDKSVPCKQGPRLGARQFGLYVWLFHMRFLTSLPPRRPCGSPIRRDSSRSRRRT
jgi:hypothetical protein